jgi:glucose-6-phosphate 1-epimerase
MDAGELSKRFSVEGVSFDRGNGGLNRIRVASDLAEAEVYLHGAHVTHFQPRGAEPLVFMSAKSSFENGKPIRGGVPICWPWFGANKTDATKPMHGFVRLAEWEVAGVKLLNDGAIELVLAYRSNDWTQTIWPENFVIRHRINVGRELAMTLEVENLSRGAIQFEEALHTYFAVGDVRQVSLEGLAGVEFHTKVKGAQSGTEGAAAKRFNSETDSVYHNTGSTCTIVDPVKRRRIVNRKDNSQTTVVWNPWIERAKAFADFGDEEWPGMLCVETANAFESAVTLAPLEHHTMTARIGVEAL